MGPRQELKRELRHMIKPWKRTSNKPPFTAEELVVMAVFLCSSSPCTQVHVLRYITQHFRYYLDLALGCTPLADARTLDLRPNICNSKFGDFQMECDLVYRQFEVPLELIPGGRPFANTWTVTPEAARAFLQDRLQPTIKLEEPQKPFPFMRLPAELRNFVYELVLQLPKRGLFVRTEKEKSGRQPVRIPAQMSVITGQKVNFSGLRTQLSLACVHDPKDCHPDLLPSKIQYCRPASTHLALLQVSKQVFQEAMPVFYSINNFIFPQVKYLQRFLERTSVARRGHIEHVSFFFNPGDENIASAAFKMLKDIAHLKELDIWVNESFWKQENKARSVELKYPDVLKVPGVFTLRSIRGLRAVRFYGSCETFEKLVPEMTSEKKVVKAPRKRKAKADADNAEPAEDAENGENVQRQIAPAKKKARKGKST